MINGDCGSHFSGVCEADSRGLAVPRALGALGVSPLSLVISRAYRPIKRPAFYKALVHREGTCQEFPLFPQSRDGPQVALAVPAPVLPQRTVTRWFGFTFSSSQGSSQLCRRGLRKYPVILSGEPVPELVGRGVQLFLIGDVQIRG